MVSSLFDHPGIRSAGLFWFMAALRTNRLQKWSESAYEKDAVVESVLDQARILINTPDTIHRMFVENAANYRRARPASAFLQRSPRIPG
jgi:hypothetical protein